MMFAIGFPTTLVVCGLLIWILEVLLLPIIKVVLGVPLVVYHLMLIPFSATGYEPAWNFLDAEPMFYEPLSLVKNFDTRVCKMAKDGTDFNWGIAWAERTGKVDCVEVQDREFEKLRARTGVDRNYNKIAGDKK